VKDITDAADRVEERGADLSQLASQIAHMHIDDVTHRIEMQIPDLLQQLRPSYHLFRAEQEKLEELVFLRCEIEVLSASRSRVLEPIKLDVLIDQPLLTAGTAAP
jgi:hypothetical protein